MYKLIATLCLASLLLSCDMVDDAKDMFEKHALAQEYVKTKYGLESQLGFNFKNGVLTDVTLVFNAKDVKSKTVSELEAIARDTTSEIFKSTPTTLVIQVVTSATDTQ